VGWDGSLSAGTAVGSVAGADAAVGSGAAGAPPQATASTMIIPGSIASFAIVFPPYIRNSSVPNRSILNME
jgi:hypothetical protein